MYLAMLGNTGVLNCYGTPPFERKGARAVTDPTYKGEIFVEGDGTASLVTWSPNHAVIDVDGAGEGTRLVYNMNYDEGWRAVIAPEGAASSIESVVVAHDDTVSTIVPPGRSRVTFRYRPQSFGQGLGFGAGALASVVVLGMRERRRRIPA